MPSASACETQGERRWYRIEQARPGVPCRFRTALKRALVRIAEASEQRTCALRHSAFCEYIVAGVAPPAQMSAKFAV